MHRLIPKILRIPPFVTHKNKNNAQQRITKERKLPMRGGEEPKWYAEEMLDTSTCPAVGLDPKKRPFTPIILPHFWIICTKIWMRAEFSSLEGFSTIFGYLANTWHPHEAQSWRCCWPTPPMLVRDHIMMNPLRMRRVTTLNRRQDSGRRQIEATQYLWTSSMTTPYRLRNFLIIHWLCSVV